MAGTIADWRRQFQELITDQNPSTAERSWEVALNLKLAHMPASLFKYREVNPYSLQNLRTRRVWLSAATSFNDPYDSSCTVDHAKLLLNMLRGLKANGTLPAFPGAPDISLDPTMIELLRSHEDPIEALITFAEDGGRKTRDIAREIVTALMQASVSVGQDTMKAGLYNMQSGMKVCSFSAAPVTKGLLMWGHYAKWHQGFCIEYEVKSFNPQVLHPVVYSETRYDFTSAVGPLRGSLPARSVMAAALHKHPDWAYEDEWRLAAPIGNASPPNGLSVSVPTPKAVYLGANIDPDDLSRVTDALCSQNVPVFQMRLSPTHFELIAKPL
jgi:hypothetical protein